MLKKIYLCVLLLTSSQNVFCWTLGERFSNMGSSGNLLDFFAPSLKTEHEVIANKIYSVINTPEKKWKIDGTYPTEGDEDLIIHFIPTTAETDNWHEKYVFHDIFSKQPISFEKIWSSTKRGYAHYSDVKYEILTQTENEMIFQIFRENQKGSYHLLGRATKYDPKRYWVLEYRVKGKNINESDKSDILNILNLLESKLLNK